MKASSLESTPVIFVTVFDLAMPSRLDQRSTHLLLVAQSFSIPFNVTYIR